MARGRRAGRVRPEVPLRRCVGCRVAKPQPELLRLAVAEGQVVPDPRKRLPGRGCSLCRDASCARAAVKGRQISRALRAGVQDPAIDRLLEWISKAPFA